MTPVHPYALVPVRLRSLSAILALAQLLSAQVVNPADKAKAEQQPQEPVAEPHQRSFERPAIVVEGQVPSGLREEDRIGDYRQPRWTSHRRFGETRVYVVPEGQVEFEYWLLPEFPDGGGSTEIASQYELEFGLPNRFQIDLYVVSHQTGNDGPSVFDEKKFEVRHALADWGVIWGNPTVYLEWAARDQASDAVEAKLLLGDELAPRWHWGSNLVYEAETGGDREHNYEWTGGISYTVSDEKLSIGAEFKCAMADKKQDRGNFEQQLLIGPSLQFRPSPQSHIDLAPLFGVTDDSPDAKIYMIFGYEF
jgi:hypothetical protein